MFRYRANYENITVNIYYLIPCFGRTTPPPLHPQELKKLKFEGLVTNVDSELIFPM